MNIVFKLLALAIVLLFSACTTKTPFKTQAPLKEAALVYVYVTDMQSGIDEGMEDSKYKTRINGKNVAGTIEAGEYKVFDMKPATVLFTAVRRNIEEAHVKLNLQAGKTYFLRTQSAAFGESYSYEQVSASVAHSELKESKLAGSFEMDMAAYIPSFGGSTAGKNDNKIPSMTEAEIDAIIEKKLQAMGASRAKVAPVVTQRIPRASSGTKLDNIKEAYEMKKQGLLTNEEFKALKVEILAK